MRRPKNRRVLQHPELLYYQLLGSGAAGGAPQAPIFFVCVAPKIRLVLLNLELLSARIRESAAGADFFCVAY
jgi:hypothetical protein